MDRFTALTETPSRGCQESGANTDQTLDVPRKIMKKISTKSCKYEAGHVGGLVFSGGHMNTSVLMQGGQCHCTLESCDIYCTNIALHCIASVGQIQYLHSIGDLRTLNNRIMGEWIGHFCQMVFRLARTAAEYIDY